MSRYAGTANYGALDYWEYFGVRLVERAAIGLGADVLDVGCGTGSSLFPAAQYVGARGRAIGIDICPH
jgi:O-methyltransferase/aklanonic acid methyltransferase